MRTFIICILVIFCACNFNKGNNHQNLWLHNSTQTTINPSKISVHKLDSFIWSRIKERPDSAYLGFKLDDSTSINITLSGDMDSGYYSLHTFNIKLPNGQIEKINTNDILTWSEHEWYKLIQIVDLNFDSKPDILIFNNAGVTGIYWYDAYVFDTSKCKYVYSAEFTNTPSLSIDSSNKILKSYYRMGFCQEVIGYYKVNGNKMIPFKYLKTDGVIWNKEGECDCNLIKEEKVNGKWVTSKINALQGDRTLYSSDSF